MAAPRIVLLVTSPRLPAGLLTAEAWDLVRAHPVYAAAESTHAQALRAGGASVTVTDPDVDTLLAHAAAQGTIVWLAGADGDPALARTLGLRLAREPSLATLEVSYGSWDPPGARLLDVVSVMDRLRSPGGCPCDREQTHLSLAQYLLEETYETYDAISSGDLDHLREELGDLLLQVAFHARIAEEHPDEGWSIDDVAAGLVDKLVRRHPHVFAGVTVDGADEVYRNWDEIKKAEKSRDSAMDGIALSQPALSLAAKILSRAARAGTTPALPPGDDLGATLLRLVADAQTNGEDAEAALRRAALAYADEVRKEESA